MRALVLVGGEGTRLRPLTLTQPKPALRARRPAVHPLPGRLGRPPRDRRGDHGLRLPGRGSPGGARRRGRPAARRSSTSRRSEPLGTAGPDPSRRGGRAAGRAVPGPQRGPARRSRPDRAAARRTRRPARSRPSPSIPVDDPSSYGLVRRARGRRGRSASSRSPIPAEIDTDEVNAGAYVIEPSVLDLIPAGRAVSIEREIFPQLVGERPLRAAARRLLDGHRDPGALPAGELGHPRGHRADRTRTASAGRGSRPGRTSRPPPPSPRGPCCAREPGSTMAR